MFIGDARSRRICLMLPVALANGVSPIEAKEVVYQAIDYLGLGRY